MSRVHVSLTEDEARYVLALLWHDRRDIDKGIARMERKFGDRADTTKVTARRGMNDSVRARIERANTARPC